MESTYQITPEMLGLSWPRVLRLALLRSAVAFLLGVLLSPVFHGRVFVGSAVGAIVVTFLSTLSARPLSRTTLRLTDDSIEELDGPFIRKDAIASVKENEDSECPGMEVLGKRKPRWLRKYRIFVPAALPQYEEVKRVVRVWATAQHMPE